MFQAGIEGFYLLRGILHSEDRFIPPQEFPDNVRERILACLLSVCERNIFKRHQDKGRVE
jgi:hypothetical protein